jgi:Tol biopolymer transport system component
MHISDTCFGAAAGCVFSTLDVVPDQLDANTSSPSISGDGRFVAYVLNGEMYVSDTCLGAPVDCRPSTIKASVSTDGAEAIYGADSPSLSADGRFVTFESTSSDLTSACCASGVSPNIYVRDTCIGGPAGCTPTTSWISWGILPVGSRGFSPAISADGHFVVFYSDWAWLVENDNNGVNDVFLAGTGR